MLVAKQIISNDNKNPNHVIIHFYGEGAFNFGKQFMTMIKSSHPFQVLVECGFIPVGDSTWMKP